MKKLLPPFFFFLIISLLIAHYPIFFSFFKQMQTDPGDTRFNNYILEHIHQYLFGNVKSFSSPQFFYPHKNTLYFSDPLIFFYPFYGIFRFCGFEYDTSFQLFMILSTILNFSFSFFLFHKIDKDKPFFNGFGACFFSSANMRLSQIGHQQLLPNIYILLCFISLFLIYKNFKENSRNTKIYIFLFFISFLFQAWSGFYNFYSLFLYLLFFFILILILKSKEFILFFKKYFLYLSISFLFFIILLIPYINKTKTIKKELGKRPIKEVYTMLPKWNSYFYLGEGNLIHKKLNISKLFTYEKASHEHRLGLGFLTTGIFLISTYSLRKNILLKLNIFVILIFFFITFYIPPEFTIWKIIYDTLPGANALRAITRLILILLLPISFILLTFLKKMNIKISLVLCFIILMEQINCIPSYEKYEIRKDVESISELAKLNKVPFFYSPLFGKEQFWKYQMDAQWASILSGVPTLNGYSGNQPKKWDLMQNIIINGEDLKRIYKNLNLWSGKDNFLWIQTIPENDLFLNPDVIILEEKLHYFIDKISDKNWKEFKNPLEIKRGEFIYISGWAKDLRFQIEKTKLYIKINDFIFPLNYGILREDVSRVYGKDYLNCGFEEKIDLKYLKENGNSISFIVILDEKYCSLKKIPLILNLKNEKN